MASANRSMATLLAQKRKKIIIMRLLQQLQVITIDILFNDDAKCKLYRIKIFPLAQRCTKTGGRKKMRRNSKI